MSREGIFPEIAAKLEAARNGTRPPDGETAQAVVHAGDLVEQPFTDLGNARRFVAMHAGRLLYAREERTWLEWRDGRWRRDVTGAAERAAKQWSRSSGSRWRSCRRSRTAGSAPSVRWALACQSAHRAARHARARRHRAGRSSSRSSSSTRDPFLFSCGNGTLDLRTGELREPDPADLITLGTDVNYIPDRARGHAGSSSSTRSSAGDAELDRVRAARLRLGAHRRHPRPRPVHRVRPRFNGKSTLNRAIQHVLGDFAHTAPIRVVMRSRQSEIPNEIAALAPQAAGVVIAETADGHRLDENRVKMLTGRDRVSARFLTGSGSSSSRSTSSSSTRTSGPRSTAQTAPSGTASG